MKTILQLTYICPGIPRDEIQLVHFLSRTTLDLVPCSFLHIILGTRIALVGGAVKFFKVSLH